MPSISSRSLPPGFALWEHRVPDGGPATGVVGVDEAGRGAWAGPVVVAAVWWPKGANSKGLNDSKQMTPAARRAQVERIKSTALGYAIVAADHDAVDRMNVRAATLEGMALTLAAVLADRPKEAADPTIQIDGNAVPQNWTARAQFVIKGDGSVPAIMAASILAKTARDAWMSTAAHGQFPLFGFAAHKGYGVPVHQAALAQWGPTALHRRTYKPVRAAAEAFALKTSGD